MYQALRLVHCVNSLISPQPSEVNTIHVLFHVVESLRLQRDLEPAQAAKLQNRDAEPGQSASEPMFVLTAHTLGTAFIKTALGHRRSLPAFPTIGLLVTLGEVFFLSFLRLLIVPIM